MAKWSVCRVPFQQIWRTLRPKGPRESFGGIFGSSLDDLCPFGFGSSKWSNFIWEIAVTSETSHMFSFLFRFRIMISHLETCRTAVPAGAAFQFARRQWGRHLDCVTSRGHMADGRWLRSSTWHWCSVMLYCVYIYIYADAYRILYAFIDVGLMYVMLCSILQGCPILTDSLSQISLERPWSTQLRMTIVKTCQLDVDGWLKDWSNHPNVRTYVQWTGPCYIACTAFHDVYIHLNHLTSFFCCFNIFHCTEPDWT